MRYILSLLLLAVIGNADYIRDDAKSTVFDTSTNLMWQDEEYTSAEFTAYNSVDYNESVKTLHWQNAINYCENLDLAGYTDWRLPNFNELHKLSDRAKHAPSIISSEFKYVVDRYHWSSTTYKANPANAWEVCFHCGDSRSDDKDHTKYVRCVRSVDN